MDGFAGLGWLFKKQTKPKFSAENASAECNVMFFILEIATNVDQSYNG